MDKNKFIVFEGIEGCGKSTQVKMLSNYLNSIGKPTNITGEVTHSDVGLLARKHFCQEEAFSENGDDEFNKFMSMLTCADRFKHVYGKLSGISDTLKTQNVICDRYKYTSRVYHCKKHGKDVSHNDKIEDFRRYNTYMDNVDVSLEPNLIFWVDTPAYIALQRVLARSENLEPYDRLEILETLQEYFQIYFEEIHKGSLVVRLDGTLPMEETHKIVLGRVLEIL